MLVKSCRITRLDCLWCSSNLVTQFLLIIFASERTSELRKFCQLAGRLMPRPVSNEFKVITNWTHFYQTYNRSLLVSETKFEIYCRAMAVCLIFMFGRIGSVAGSNLIGLLITTNCNLVLIIFATILSSKYFVLHVEYSKIQIRMLNLGCVVLCQLFLKTPTSKWEQNRTISKHFIKETFLTTIEFYIFYNRPCIYVNEVSILKKRSI